MQGVLPDEVRLPRQGRFPAMLLAKSAGRCWSARASGGFVAAGPWVDITTPCADGGRLWPAGPAGRFPHVARWCLRHVLRRAPFLTRDVIMQRSFAFSCSAGPCDPFGLAAAKPDPIAAGRRADLMIAFGLDADPPAQLSFQSGESVFSWPDVGIFTISVNGKMDRHPPCGGRFGRSTGLSAAWSRAVR